MKDKKVIFVNFDTVHAVSGGSYVFFRLANAYYETYGNAEIYTVEGRSLDVLKDELTIPIELVKLRAKKPILKAIGYNFKLLFLLRDFDFCVTNQHIFGGHLKCILTRKKHLYLMHDHQPLKNYKKITDKLYMLIVKFFLKLGRFVCVSRTHFRGNRKLIEVIYNGI